MSEMYGETFELELRPDEDQRERLRDFLSELMLISRKYGILIETHHRGEQPMLVDLHTDTVVGIDLAYRVHGDFVRSYECDMAIYDGVWPVVNDVPDDARNVHVVRRQDGKAVDPTTQKTMDVVEVSGSNQPSGGGSSMPLPSTLPR